MCTGLVLFNYFNREEKISGFNERYTGEKVMGQNTSQTQQEQEKGSL